MMGKGDGDGGSKSLDLNMATVKRYGDSHLVAKSPFSKKATVYLATVTISTVANYTLPWESTSTIFAEHNPPPSDKVFSREDKNSVMFFFIYFTAI